MNDDQNYKSEILHQWFYSEEKENPTFCTMYWKRQYENDDIPKNTMRSSRQIKIGDWWCVYGRKMGLFPSPDLLGFQNISFWPVLSRTAKADKPKISFITESRLLWLIYHAQSCPVEWSTTQFASVIMIGFFSWDFVSWLTDRYDQCGDTPSN